MECDKIKKSINPSFGNLKGVMHFRGTMDDLTDKLLEVTLNNESGLGGIGISVPG
jgi:hypothetical protein